MVAVLESMIRDEYSTNTLYFFKLQLTWSYDQMASKGSSSQLYSVICNPIVQALQFMKSSFNSLQVVFFLKK